MDLSDPMDQGQTCIRQAGRQYYNLGWYTYIGIHNLVY